MSETKHESFGFSFATIVHQLRIVQIVGLFVELVILYMESDRIGLALLFPLVLHVLNFYHTGRRLYYNIDGRFDMQQLISVADVRLKLRYAAAVFGSLLLALIAHFVTPKIVATMSELFYTLGDFAAITAAGIVVGAEVYETVKSKIA